MLHMGRREIQILVGGLSLCFAADWQLKGLNLIFQEDRVGIRVRVGGGVQVLRPPHQAVFFFKTGTTD